MTIEDAKAVVASGPGTFGAVFPLLGEADREALRAWFVSTPEVRPAAPAPARPVAPAVRPKPVATGEVCKCGGLLVRTGTCMTCSMCAESSGGCS